jgi:hypothetical protein
VHCPPIIAKLIFRFINCRDLEDSAIGQFLQRYPRPAKERMVHRLRLSKARSRRNEAIRVARRGLAQRQDNDRLLDIEPGKFLTVEQQERLCSIWKVEPHSEAQLSA